MKKFTEEQYIDFQEALDFYIDEELKKVNITMHSTTLERITDAVAEYLVEKKIVVVKD